MTAFPSAVLSPPRRVQPYALQTAVAVPANGPAALAGKFRQPPTQGNTIVAFFGSRTGQPHYQNHVPPDGTWVLAKGQGRGGSGTPQLSAWLKVAGAGEPDTYAFADPGGNGFSGATGLCTLTLVELPGIMVIGGLELNPSSTDGGPGNVPTLTLGPTPEPTTWRPVALAHIAVSSATVFANTWIPPFTQLTFTTLSTTAIALETSPVAFSTAETWSPSKVAEGLIIVLRPCPSGGGPPLYPGPDVYPSPTLYPMGT